MNLTEFKRSFQLFENYAKPNRLGIFEIESNSLFNFYEKEIANSLFLKSKNGATFSRGNLYYTNGSIKVVEMLIGFINDMEKGVVLFPKLLEFALYENVLNAYAVLWYNCWKNNYNNSSRIWIEIEEMKQLLVDISYNLLAVAVEKERVAIGCRLRRFQNMFYDCNIVHHGIELDDKFTIVDEICFFLDNFLKGEPNIVLVFPLLGSFYLSVFYDALCKMLNITRHENIIVQIGFHDQMFNGSILPDHYEKNINLLKDKQVLIWDDNIGTGRTISTLKNHLKTLNAVPLTRVAEIPWDILLKTNSVEKIADIIDFPTVKNNLRNYTKKQFIRNIIDNETDFLLKTHSLQKKKHINAEIINNLFFLKKFTQKQQIALIQEFEFFNF